MRQKGKEGRKEEKGVTVCRRNKRKGERKRKNLKKKFI